MSAPFADECIPDYFLCPISRELMIDPVVCVDGFSYEREVITHWFRQQPSQAHGEVNYTSPATGERIQSALLVRNINLAKAISAYAASTGRKNFGSITKPASSSKAAPSTDDSSSAIESLQFSPWSLGKGLTLEEHRSLAVKASQSADTVDWYEFIAFSAFPSRFTSDEKPRALFLIEQARTGYGGIALGFSPVAPDRIKAPEVKDFVDANAWWIDGNSWFHSPNGGAVLVPWSSSRLKQGDKVGILVAGHGRFCVFVNGVKTVDIKDTDLPVKVGTQLYGFVGLNGGYTKIRIIQDSPDDWCM